MDKPVEPIRASLCPTLNLLCLATGRIRDKQRIAKPRHLASSVLMGLRTYQHTHHHT